ncbi:MAG: PIN domain-containing protein, partial [Acidimicrobiales bacterium]
VLDRLVAETGTGGNLTNDAHLAALALQHKADIVSFDNDFGRFPGVQWHRPGEQRG